jgi:FAD/FMN-containing dehydrogenase
MPRSSRDGGELPRTLGRRRALQSVVTLATSQLGGVAGASALGCSEMGNSGANGDRVTRALANLQRELPNKVSVPGTPEFSSAVSLWAKARHVPQFVVHCSDTSDVQRAVRAAREAALPLAVRGGGHDWAGRALSSGLVLDLSPMRAVNIAPDRLDIRVGGGALAVDALRASDPLGLALATGSIDTVGLAGLTLGGGYGPLAARFGLACDNLIRAEVVLADGSVTIADDVDGDADLIWALRGGGGNFGVVTALDLRLHPVPIVRSGVILYPREQALTIFAGIAAVLDAAPDALGLQAGMIPAPNGDSVVGVLPTWSGSPDRGQAVIAQLSALGSPIMTDVTEQTFGASRAMAGRGLASGLQTHIETVWLRRLDAEPVRVLVEQIERRPSPLCFFMTHSLRGEATRVAPEATAFGHREQHIMIEIIAQSAAPSAADGFVERDWARQTLQRLLPLALPGGYGNLLDRADTGRASQSYGPNAGRLRELKRRFDPDGVFASAIPLPG